METLVRTDSSKHEPRLTATASCDVANQTSGPAHKDPIKGISCFRLSDDVDDSRQRCSGSTDSGWPELSVSPEQHSEDQRDVITVDGRRRSLTSGHLLTDTPALCHFYHGWRCSSSLKASKPQINTYRVRANHK